MAQLIQKEAARLEESSFGEQDTYGEEREHVLFVT